MGPDLEEGALVYRTNEVNRPEKGGQEKMMRSLFSAVSGLKAHQQRMDVIGNNIANVNTPGFKKSQTTFQDMLSQMIRGASRPVSGGRGGTNPMQVGLGVTIGGINTIMTAGSIQDTGKNTDLAIEGDGFFVVSDGSRSYYTRAGAFDFDSDGYLVDANGMHVMGWLADGSGKIDNSPGNVQNIRINQGIQEPARATTQIVLTGNLDAGAINNLIFPTSGTNSTKFKVSGGGGTAECQIVFTPTDTLNKWNWTISVLSGGTLSSGGTGTLTYDATNPTTPWSATGSATIAVNNNPPPGSTAFDITISNTNQNSASGCFTNISLENPTDRMAVSLQQAIYDSLGNKYNATIYFERKPGGQWDWKVKDITNSEGKSITSTTPAGTFSGSGTINFDSTGKLTTGGTGTITFDPDGTTGYMSPLTINLDLSKLTQYASETTATASQDGYSAGSLQSVSFDTTGTLSGVFSNGITRPLAQVALASFNNPGGLVKEGNTLFAVSSNSGDANIGSAGIGGLGTIRPGSLEMSNVDLAQEFTDMIVTQRGFQANSRVITASDEMLQDLVNLKR